MLHYLIPFMTEYVNGNFSSIFDQECNYLTIRNLTVFENENWANLQSKQFLIKLILKHFIQPLFSMENKHSVMNMEMGISVLLLMKFD